jgi:hypothetical protein
VEHPRPARGDPDPGETLGRAASEEFAVRAAQVGLSQAERLWEALPSYALRNKSRIESANASDAWGSSDGEGDIIGRMFDAGDLALMPEAVKELAERIGLGDPETALEGLAKAGRLRLDSSGKRPRPVRSPGSRFVPTTSSACYQRSPRLVHPTMYQGPRRSRRRTKRRDGTPGRGPSGGSIWAGQLASPSGTRRLSPTSPQSEALVAGSGAHRVYP